MCFSCAPGCSCVLSLTSLTSFVMLLFTFPVFVTTSETTKTKCPHTLHNYIYTKDEDFVETRSSLRLFFFVCPSRPDFVRFLNRWALLQASRRRARLKGLKLPEAGKTKRAPRRRDGLVPLVVVMSIASELPIGRNGVRKNTDTYTNKQTNTNTNTLTQTRHRFRVFEHFF